MSGDKGEVLCFGTFRLDMRRGRLLCRDQEIRLRPKAWAVLYYLATRAGHVVPIDELLDACWKDLHVGPHAVTNVIYLLRSVFTAGNGDADWIQSVSRRGYRFTAPLQAGEPAAESGSRPVEDAGRADETPDAELFVGRHEELDLLLQRWRQALRGTPQVAFIAGEPGIGKTAVTRRFCAAAAPAPLLCIGRCVPQHSEAEPYMPVLEALGSLESVAEVIEVAREQAPTWLIQMPWLLSKAERTSLRQSLAGVGPARMLREGKRLFSGLTEQSPVLLVLEDVHWADSATVDLIRALAESDRPGRLMLIVTYRPSEVVVQNHPLRHVVNELSSRLRNVDLLSLDSFTPALVHEYLERRFASPELAGAIAPRLEEKSGGNPLFLVAMTNYLCEQGRILRGEDGWQLSMAGDDVDVGLPDGLRDMIRTHLRRLAPNDLHLLQAASAAGEEFSTLEVAAALELSALQAEQACDSIARHGDFIRAIGEVIWPDGSVGDSYRFAHVAYGQALRDDISPPSRRSLHARIGQRLAAGYGKRAREIAPRLAKHFEAAGDLERELDNLKLSVQLAAGRYAHREALAYIDRTLDVLDRLPTSDERATQQLGWLVERGNLAMDWLGYAGGYDTFRRAVVLAKGQGSSFLEFIGHAGCCMAGMMGLEHRAEARAEADFLLSIAAHDHPELAALAHLLAGGVRDTFGDPEGAVSHAEAALDALPNALQGLPRQIDLETSIHVLLMTSLTRLGKLDRAARERALAVEGAETRSGLAGQAHAFAFLACDALVALEPAMALGYALRAIESAREGGFDYFMTAGEAARETALSMLAPDGNVDSGGLERLAAAIEKRRHLDENWYNMLFAAHLADAYRRGGELERARTQIDAAFDEADASYVAELWRIKGEIELAVAGGGRTPARKRDTTAAARCFQKSIDVAQQHAAKLLELRSTVALARLRRGAEGTRDALATIHRSFSEGFDSTDLQAAAALLRQLDVMATP